MPQLPPGKRIAFLIRDDDTCALTPPAYLEKVYDTAWQLGFPVTLATVPCIQGSHNLNIPPSERGSGKRYPLQADAPITSFLKKQQAAGLVDIAQHGYAHTTDQQLQYPPFGVTEGFDAALLRRSSEFYGLSAQEAEAHVQEGKQHLEEALGRPITTFVAPQEYLTPGLWRAIARSYEGYSGGLRPRYWEQLGWGSVRLPVLGALVADVLKRKSIGQLGERVSRLTTPPIFPATRRHYWSGFLTDEQAEQSLEEAKRAFEEKYAQPGSYFLLLTHYWEYFGDWQAEITQERQKEYLDRFLQFVNDHEGVWKTSLSELSAWRRQVARGAGGRTEK